MKKMKNLIEDMNKAMAVLSEAYMMNDEDDYGYDEEYDDEGLMGPQEPHGQEPQEGEDEGVNLAAKDKRIIQMRELALQGLQDYADDVTNPFYEFYKKVWLETDKMCDNKEEMKR